ncbi:MAG: hypothetical protein IK093_18110 [Ruminiclostridium sp.]|nr:hypothetical protein [Ruminiclostridium sp.]
MDKRKYNEFVGAVDIVCCECYYGSDSYCGKCPVSRTYEKMGGIQRLRSDYIKGYTRALLDVKSYIERNEATIKKARLTGYTGILKLLDILITGREELRETGNLLIAKTPDGSVIPQSELKKQK